MFLVLTICIINFRSKKILSIIIIMDMITLTNIGAELYVNGSNAIPTGSIMCFSGATVPQGWLLCNGQSINRNAYNNLFNIIGTIYGSR